VLITRQLFGAFEGKDVYVNSKPFDEETFSKIVDHNNTKIKIGWFSETKTMDTASSVKEVVDDVCSRLAKQGYEVVPFPIDDLEELFNVGLQLMANSDAFNLIEKTIDGEELVSFYSAIKFMNNAPRWLLNIVAYIKSITGEKRASALINKFAFLDRREFIDKSKRFNELKAEFIKYWKKENYTAIICPVMPTPAISPNVSDKFISFNTSNFLFNFLDMPSCAVPVKLNENVDFRPKFNDSYTRAFEKEIKDSKGLPLGVQVGALPQQDEIVLRIMKEIAYYYEFEKVVDEKIFEICATNTHEFREKEWKI